MVTTVVMGLKGGSINHQDQHDHRLSDIDPEKRYHSAKALMGLKKTSQADGKQDQRSHVKEIFCDQS